MAFFDRGADQRSKNGIYFFSKSRVSKVMGPAMGPQIGKKSLSHTIFEFPYELFFEKHAFLTGSGGSRVCNFWYTGFWKMKIAFFERPPCPRTKNGIIFFQSQNFQKYILQR